MIFEVKNPKILPKRSSSAAARVSRRRRGEGGGESMR